MIMSDVLERIEMRELVFSVNHHGCGCYDEDSAKELLRLAKIGKAALLAVDGGCTEVCVTYDDEEFKRDEANEYYICSNNDECPWASFCKYRKEVTPDER